MSDLYNSIEELVLELEDDESGLERGRTVALVAGAYRPPHLGHVSMVEQYAQNVDEVVVLVSSALKGNRVIGEPPEFPTPSITSVPYSRGPPSPMSQVLPTLWLAVLILPRGHWINPCLIVILAILAEIGLL